MTNEPTRGVSGNIKLRHDTNAAVARVRDHVLDLFLRVVIAIRTQLVQLWKLLALDAEALVFGQMPVKDVHLHRRHRVEIALEHFDGLEVTRDVDQQTAPGETWLVV